MLSKKKPDLLSCIALQNNACNAGYKKYKLNGKHIIALFTSFRWLLLLECTVPEKYPYSPHRRDWNFLGDWGFWKIKKYKEMYEALPEFTEGGGGVRKNPFRGGGMDIFWN